MKRTRQKKIPLETELAHLAMQFRSAGSEAERTAVAGCYEKTVKQLIRSGEWEDMPAFEDMLPNEWMPEAFFKFWSIPSPHGHAPSERAMTISVTYPLFVLVDGETPILVDGKEGKARVPALAIFTDREAAEQSRDEHSPKGKVVMLPEEESFARTLQLVRERIAIVVFDPHRRGKRGKTIPVEEMLRQLPHPR